MALNFLFQWIYSIFLYNLARVINTFSFPFREKLKTLQNELLNTKCQLHPLGTCRTKKTSSLVVISNFNKTKSLSWKQALNKRKTTSIRQSNLELNQKNYRRLIIDCQWRNCFKQSYPIFWCANRFIRKAWFL